MQELLKLFLYFAIGAPAIVIVLPLFAYCKAAVRGELPEDAMDNDNWYKK